MADLKISALTASTTPLAGTEVLPIVQSSTTKQVSVANLTAGRAISATQLTLSTGSLIVANGQGVDFSATPGTGTSELFADYEEGIWTPIDSSGAGLTFTSVQGTYTKVGRLVSAICRLNYPSTVSTNNAVIGGLPFAAGSYGGYSGGGSVQQKSAAAAITGLYIAASATTATVADNQNGLMQNAVLSSAQLYINFVYYA
jgi:hypothetical protein